MDLNFLSRNLLVCFLLILVNIYLLYHIFSGDYGIMSYVQIKNEEIQKKIDLQRATYDIAAKKNKIRGLKASTLDPDLLEEELKRKLGYGAPNEIVVFIEDSKK